MTSDKKFAIRILDENVIFAFPIDFVTEFFIFFLDFCGKLKPVVSRFI